MATLLVSSISYAETPRFNSTGSMTHGSGDNAVTLFDSADFYTLQSSSDALQSDVDTLSTNVSSVSSELRNDMQEVNLAVFGDPGDPSIPSYESRIAEMEESLNNSADGFMAQVDRLDSRVTGLENRMSGLENAARTTSYTITYDYAGGSAVNTPSYTDSTPTFTLNAPTKTGYTFSGWIGSGIDPNTPQMTVTVAEGSMGDLSYTATWDPITYYVKYDANGGTGAPSGTTTVQYGQSIAISTATPARSGYTFQGWSMSSGATSASYTGGNSCSNLSAVNGATITLYAVWQADEYTILITKGMYVRIYINGIELSSSGTQKLKQGDVIIATQERGGTQWYCKRGYSDEYTEVGYLPKLRIIVPSGGGSGEIDISYDRNGPDDTYGVGLYGTCMSWDNITVTY